MFPFTVVARDENLASGDDDVDGAVSLFLGAVIIGFAGIIVRVEGGGVVIWVGPDSEDAVGDLNAFAGEGDDSLDDVLVFDARFGLAAEMVVITAVGEDNDLTALGDVGFALKMGDCNG